MGLAMVCADPEVAAALVGQGAQVVLCGTDPARLADTAVALRAAAAAGAPSGRLAVMVGDLADPEVEGAARAMAAELFGGEATVVRSLSDAGQQIPDPPGSEQAGSGTV